MRDLHCVCTEQCSAQAQQCKHRYVTTRTSQPEHYLWYLMRVGKLVPVSQCRKLLRGTGYMSSMMLRQQAHPHPAPTLQTHPDVRRAIRAQLQKEGCHQRWCVTAPLALHSCLTHA